MADNASGNRPTHSDEASTKRNERDAKDQRWMVWFTGAIAFFALIQAITTGLQWRETRDALELTRQSNRLMQRAWVIVPGTDPPRTLVAGVNDFDIRMKNVGAIPASDVTAVTVISVLPVAMAETPRQIKGDTPRISVTVIGPGEQRRLLMPKQAPFTLSPEQAKDVAAGKITIMVWGRVTYSDPIKTIGETGFCMVYEEALGFFRTCAHGNYVK